MQHQEVIGQLLQYIAPAMGTLLLFIFGGVSRTFFKKFEEMVQQSVVITTKLTDIERKVNLVDAHTSQLSEIRRDVERALLMSHELSRTQDQLRDLVKMSEAIHRRIDEDQKARKKLNNRVNWMVQRVMLIKMKGESQNNWRFDGTNWECGESDDD